MCCPSAKDCIIPRKGSAETAGQILAGLGMLDLAGAMLRMFTIDWMSGMFFLVNCWIIYIAYATLNWCNCTLIIVTAILDAAMTGMMWK
jgi:hypothetical protein